MNSRRALRLRKLTELVSSRELRTQEEVCEALTAEGWQAVTRRADLLNGEAAAVALLTWSKKVAATSVPASARCRPAVRHCNQCSASPFSMLPPPETR